MKFKGRFAMRKAEFAGDNRFIGSHVADQMSNVRFHVTILNRNKPPWLRSGKKLLRVIWENLMKLLLVRIPSYSDMSAVD